MEPETVTMPPELTFGQKAVGITFNPSKDGRVDRMKQHYANIIDSLNDMRTGDAMLSGDQARVVAIAITEAQTAQMWAVKALTS